MDSKENEIISLTVVIPIRNESRFIRQTLDQLLAQDLGSINAEFIVVDGQSTDGTQEIVEDVRRANPGRAIYLFENPKRLSSAARNIGLNRSRGRYVLIVDGHVYLPTPDILRRGIELADENEARVVGRPQRLTPPGLTELQKIVAAVRASRIGHSIESHIYSQTTGFVSPISVAVMYDRELAVEYGGFDESFDAAEDLEFNYRLEQSGIECFISPELEVFYYPRDSIGGLFKQMRRYGLGRARFLRKHPSRLTVEAIVPACFVIGMPALALLGLWDVFFFKVFLALAVVYSFIAYIANRNLFRLFGLKALIALPVALAVHVGLGVGFLHGMLSRRPSGKD